MKKTDQGSSTPRPGRPRDPEKRRAILEAAGKLFMEHGFHRTTMDAIAAGAGVSKLTVYSHFEDKDGLFRELIERKCEEYFEGRTFSQLAALAPEEALARIARSFMGLMFNRDVLALHRVLIGGASQNADVNRTFYATGPDHVVNAVAGLLGDFDRQGKLKLGKPRLAADHFLSMLKGDLHLRALLNVEAAPSETRLRDHIKDCVAVFLRAYAPR